MSNIKVLNGGIFTTVQDYGRVGYQKFGISVAGVMDEFDYAIANALVGNKKGTAVLEVTYFGPAMVFDEDMVVAVTGADMNPKLDNVSVNMYESFEVKKGQKLTFGIAKSGVRSYIAFGGEIDVTPVNGSKSTHVKSHMGGYKGRQLKPNDELNIIVNSDAVAGRKLPEKFIPKISPFNVIRVVLGPQDDYFTEKGIHTLFTSGGYTLSKDMDRMGIRLLGDALEFKEGADIISDGTVMGSIQVPANGRPIILMADRQTTGGYTKVGTVVREDIPKLAQMSALNKICFEEVSLEKAQEMYIDYENYINTAIEAIKENV